MKNKLFIILSTLILTAQTVYSAAVKSVVVKFSLAMGGVVLSSVLIFLGLTIYNKLRDSITPEEEILKHPKTKDEAIKFFIRKNKIQ